jgi:hypothetical protein
VTDHGIALSRASERSLALPKGFIPRQTDDLRSDPIRGNSKRKTTCKSVAYVASVPHDLEAPQALG